MYGLAKDTGIDCIYIGEFASPDVQETAINASYEIASNLIDSARSDKSYNWSNTISDLAESNPAKQLQHETVKKWWPAMIGESVRQRIILIEILKRATEQRTIVGCVVHEDVTPDMRTLVEFCKLRGIPTIHIPHANCFYRGESWDIHTESISDFVAAGGEYMKRFYSKWGFDESKITITGSPSMDSWYTDNPPSRSEARQVLGIGADEFVIVYASSWSQLTSTRSDFDVEHQRDFGLVMDAAKRLKATLCIKMHPGEAQDMEKFYLENLKGNGIRGFVVRQYNEYVLRAGDLLIAQGPSNICVQSVVCGIPTLYIPTEDFAFERGPIMIGENVMDAIAIAKGMTKEYWQEWLDDVCAYGGQGTERTTQFIMEKCNATTL